MTRHWLVAPPLDGPITGGTLYNRFLVEALERTGDEVRVVESVDACEGFAWVDSLYLPRVADTWATRPMGLLAHYLPSVFEQLPALTAFETAALEHAAHIVCTGSWMQDAVHELSGRSTDLVEPGIHAAAAFADPKPGPIEAVLVGTVTPRKGLLHLLEAIAEAPPRSPWSLTVLGDMEANPAYTAACQAVASSLPIRFCGALPPADALQTVARASLLLSAARIESYGMAIAEAQACGVPVIARAGGHVERLIERVPTDILVDDVRELTRAFAIVVDTPPRLATMRECSRRNAPQRSWDDAAREFQRLRMDP